MPDVGGGDAGIWVVALISCIVTALGGTLGAWIMNLLKARADQRRQSRGDALQEWQVIVNQLRDDNRQIQARCDHQDKEIVGLLKEVRDCETRSSDLRAEVKLLTADVRRLQTRSDELPPATVSPANVTATLDGKIRSVTGGVAPLLHWLPHDLVGQNIDVLVPERLRARHKAGLLAVAEGRHVPDPGVPILTEALRKDGVEVAVAIVLASWSGVDGKTVYINAEIARRRRGSPGDSGVLSSGPTRAPGGAGS